MISQLAVLVFFWLMNCPAHYLVDASSKRAIVLPRIIAFLFGSFREDGVLSFPGMLWQIIFGVGLINYCVVVILHVISIELSVLIVIATVILTAILMFFRDWWIDQKKNDL